jgi:hypothetical protein
MKECSHDQLTHGVFSARLQGSFKIQVEGVGEIAAQLAEVRRLPSRPRPGASEGSEHADSFALLFVIPVDRFLPQRTYQFSHESMGQFPLFIVPVGQDGRGLLYEAVFNRL